MLFSSTFLTLAVGLAVYAAPSVQRRQLEEGATCTYHLIPQRDADGINLIAEMNFAIGRQIAVETNAGLYNGGMTPEPHLDGSVTASGTIASDALTKDELKALVESWPERKIVLLGAPQNGYLNWTVESVFCEG